jgi:hypothetical protein
MAAGHGCPESVRFARRGSPRAIPLIGISKDNYLTYVNNRELGLYRPSRFSAKFRYSIISILREDNVKYTIKNPQRGSILITAGVMVNINPVITHNLLMMEGNTHVRSQLY